MAAALRAGKPQIPCPVMLDQPHNAEIIKQLGCALDVIPFSTAYKSPNRLQNAINRVLTDKGNLIRRANEVRDIVVEESNQAFQITLKAINQYSVKFS